MRESTPANGDGAATGEAREALAAAPSIFQNRNFLLLWLAQAFSQVGQNALILGLLVLVENLTHSPTQLSFATLSLVLPAVIFGLLAGVVIDRLNKKTVMVATNILRALVSLSYLALNGTVFLIHVASFTFATVGQFFAPAEASAIPLLVKREQLITANSLFNLTLNVSQLLGLVILAPLLIKIVGVTGFFIVLALLFSIAALCVSALPSEKKALVGEISTTESQAMVRSVWADLLEGARILRSDSLASLAMLYLTLMASLIPLLAVIGPIYATNVLRTSAEDMVYLFAPAGVGMFMTTLVLGRLVARFGKLRLMHAALLAMGVTLALLAGAKVGGGYLLYNVLGRVVDTHGFVLELIPIVMALSFTLGIEFVCVSIPAQTLLQERCPPDFRGRIFGVQFTLSGAGSVLPLLGAGGIADLFGVNKTILLIGMAVFAFGMLGMRRVLRGRWREEEGEAPRPGVEEGPASD